MKILFLGDASNYHNTLAVELRRQGHDVTVASDGTRWMDTDRDIDLSRRPGKLGGLWLWIKLRYILSKRLAGYDVVSICDTYFAALRPKRLRQLFDRLKRNNGKVFMTALGTDTYFIDECLDTASPLRYNEWRVGDRFTDYYRSRQDIVKAFQSEPLRGFSEYLAREVDGVMTALYEYDVACSRFFPRNKIHYCGIPVDLDSIEYSENRVADGEPVKILLCCHADRMVEKGADRLLAAARRVESEYPGRCKVEVVNNLPFNDFVKRLENCNIVLDQLYSYTPATTALMAMAMGKTVVSGGEPDYYDFIEETDLRPIVNVRPDDDAIYEAIKNLVLNPSGLPVRGAESRRFVERHNASTVVARRFLQAVALP